MDDEFGGGGEEVELDGHMGGDSHDVLALLAGGGCRLCV